MLNYSEPKPDYATLDEWKDWRERIKIAHPVLYFIRETIPTKWRRTKRFFSDIKYAILWRTTSRWYMVNTGLGPGYYDTDTRMTHAVFSLLIDFVEKDKAYKYIWCHYETHKYPWFWQNPDPQLGIDYLNWETTLDNPELAPNESSPRQAQAAREILAIYHWLKNERINPWEAESLEEEEKAYRKDEEMLIRIMKIRGSLWT